MQTSMVLHRLSWPSTINAMSSVDFLMAIKVLILVAAGAAFVVWQWRDLAQERRRTEEREKQLEAPKQPTDM